MQPRILWVRACAAFKLGGESRHDSMSGQTEAIVAPVESRDGGLKIPDGLLEYLGSWIHDGIP
jgi:hypothetical protein